MRSLTRAGGIVVIDVPNMDWLFAFHERYMDFTHEVGFTKESLLQVMREVFDDVSIDAVDNDVSVGLRRLRTRVGRAFASLILGFAEPDMRGQPIWSRSIVAVGRT
jgi:hypothetical protein